MSDLHYSNREPEFKKAALLESLSEKAGELDMYELAERVSMSETFRHFFFIAGSEEELSNRFIVYGVLLE
jgi:hypothetical protein